MIQHQLFWFKRDLRLADNAPLQKAHASGLPVLHIFLLEPLFKNHPAWSLRHWQAQYASALELQKRLAAQQQILLILHGSAADIFRALHRHLPLKAVYSHQETDVAASYQRDKYLKQTFTEWGLPWHEFVMNGVFRGRQNRHKWDEDWRRFMQAPKAQVKFLTPSGVDSTALEELEQQFALPPALKKELEQYPSAFQPVGERAAQERLNYFLQGNYYNYSRHISKPSASRISLSRLSVYLAWGNLSLRQVYQAARATYENSTAKNALRNFISRLHWHSHFVQKFEMEHSMEQRSINRGFKELEKPLKPHLVEAWQKGKTGYPLVDASMRALHQTGYINFRMRALLVSFFCHHLWQPWQAGVHFLGQQFLDYIPGIHYPQFQMQAGVTGINTFRIYNPVKQSQDHDPKADFISTYLPELDELPLAQKAMPWELSALEQGFYNFNLGETYPAPIVEHKTAAAFAKQKLFAAKKWPQVKKESLRILTKHTTAIRNIDTRTQAVLKNDTNFAP
jgi:deoxyribodipyrimidine photo-lyase